MTLDDKKFLLFPVTWAVLGVGLLAFNYFSRFETKRRWHSRITVGVGLLFLSFVAATQPPLFTFFFMVPAVALITLLNLKLTKFCSKCRSRLYGGFTAMKFCHKCGAPLNPE